MKSAKKHTFYPAKEVETELEGIPRGQLSERVNELIVKGLTYERQQEVALAYQKYDLDLANTPRNFESSSARFMSAGAFQAEDEEEDFA